jgi:hypothetical protein
MARRRQPKLVLGKDFIYDENRRAHLTREYLLSLGECCGNHCKYCPWQGSSNGGGNCAPHPTTAQPRETPTEADVS